VNLNKYSFREVIVLYALGISPISILIGILSLFKIVPGAFQNVAV